VAFLQISYVVRSYPKGPGSEPFGRATAAYRSDLTPRRARLFSAVAVQEAREEAKSSKCLIGHEKNGSEVGLSHDEAPDFVL